MHAWRYLSAELARASVVITAIASVVLVATDALDPTARGQTLADTLPRALWLFAAGTVVGVSLAPANVLHTLRRTGGAHAMESSGTSVARTLLLPVMLLSLCGSVTVGVASTAAAHETVLHPGTRPQPLAVVPWGAPTSGCWQVTPAGGRFVRIATVHGTATGCGAGAPSTLPWVLTMAALVAAPLGLVATARARTRGVWVGAGLTLLTMAASVVVGAHLLGGGVVAYKSVLVAMCLMLAGTLAAAWVGQRIGSEHRG